MRPMTQTAPPTPPGFTDAVQSHLQTNDARISRLTYQGQFYWVKRAESLSLRMRLQKGNATSAFEAERQALHQLDTLGISVPTILDEGSNYFVLPHSGDTLRHLLHHSAEASTRLQAFSAAGQTLANLHQKGFSHGRPAIRDFCWNAPDITLLDFERFSAARNTVKGHMQDLIIFAHSALSDAQGYTPELGAALETYRAMNPHNTWDRAAEYCARMSWINWLTKPVQWRKSGKAKEFKAIPMVFDLFAGRNVVMAQPL